ncbi:MAG: ribosomal protein S18-alanine N-acetyltransferase [Coprobacillus sp.]|nr:ribosomal protein S18-alanine N-acetyltransferase [Coprobacillus sp.]
MNIEIVEMSDNDLDQVLEIENLCFISKYSRDDFLYELHENQYGMNYVAKIGEKVVGFALCYYTFDSASIAQIATHPDYQNNGIGSAMLSEIFDDCYAKKIQTITLEVRENNKKAFDFYIKNGFKEVLIKVGYYSNGDNAIYMIKKIEEV